jgi:hypothetical protein
MYEFLFIVSYLISLVIFFFIAALVGHICGLDRYRFPNQRITRTEQEEKTIRIKNKELML